MTKEELEKATGQELIDERNYCGVDGYYGVYLDNVNAEMLKRFNRLAELEEKLKHAEENCINKTCVVLKDKEDCVAKLLELEKENAELKERLKEHESIGNAQFWKNVWSWKTKADQLTKAKEIIKELMSFSVQLCDCRHTVDFEKTREEAEQFLSEVEKCGQ